MERYEQYIGKTLNGKYTIKELLGVGGMAYVFKATVEGSGQVVSVKILNEESSRDEKSVRRFLNESKAVAMLSHPNIVKIYDVVFEKDINYLVMEYVEGITMKEYIDFKKTIEWGEAVYYVSQILRALGHAHSMGIIHRDVKPQNIMITREGVVKVMDFGIAKMLKSESITMTDMALGTVDYISPEQASGKEIGFYSDIYSVGVMLYEMTTGKLPFIAESTMAVAMMQIQDEPQPPTEIAAIPRGLEQIILKAMNKEPDERFSSCAAMEKALGIISQNPATVFTSHHKSGEKKKAAEKTKKRSSFLAIISGVTAAFFIVLIVFAVMFLKQCSSSFNDTGKEIVIPSLVGQMHSEELAENYKKDGYDIKVSTKEVEHDPEKPVGEIIHQTPSEGTRKKYDPDNLQTVTVTLNPPAKVFVLDNYTNANAQEVTTLLRRNDINWTLKSEDHDTVIKGYVIKTDPEPGTVLKKGDTITLYVSNGAPVEEVTVPKVTGLTYEEAVRELQKNRISIGIVDYEESDAPEGTVISQSVAEGETVYKYITEIELTVSSGRVVIILPEPTTPVEDEAPAEGVESDELSDIGEEGTEESETPAEETENETAEATEDNNEKVEPDISEEGTSSENGEADSGNTENSEASPEVADDEPTEV